MSDLTPKVAAEWLRQLFPSHRYADDLKRCGDIIESQQAEIERIQFQLSELQKSELHPDWSTQARPLWPEAEVVGRKEDMSPDGRLRIWRQDDGDVIVEILNLYDDHKRLEYMRQAQVEFCSSGGKSPRTRLALFALMHAIEQDNINRPEGADPGLADL